eukprot:1176444-Prorocentrum_minimum.AAC.3
MATNRSGLFAQKGSNKHLCVFIALDSKRVAGRDGWAPWRWRRADGHGSTRPYTSGATKRSGT